MIASDFKDIDGFRLQFEESVPDDERTYYMRTFLRVDDVSKDRVHCTTCDMHVSDNFGSFRIFSKQCLEM